MIGKMTRTGKILWVSLTSLFLISLISGVIFFVLESPRKPLRSVLKQLESRQQEQIVGRLDEQTSPKKQQVLIYLLEDIWSAQTISTTLVKDESWRQQGEIQIPTPKYIASHYHAQVNVQVNDYTLPLLIHFKRSDTLDEYHFFSFVFKPWRLVDIQVVENQK